MAESTETDDHFELIGDNIIFEKNKRQFTNKHKSWIGDMWNSLYGSMIILGSTNKTYKAKFKIITKNSSTTAINIGIECEPWLNINSNFVDQTSNPNGQYYAYCSNGKKYSHIDGCKYGKSFSDSYGNNDIIGIKLQFISGVDYGLLCFKKNNSIWHDTFFKVRKTKKIRIAVSLRSAGYFEGGQSSMELLSFSCFDKNQNDSDDEKMEKKTPEIVVNEEIESAEQKEISQLKMQIESMKEELTTRQGKCVSLEKANHVLRDERDEIQNKLQKEFEGNMAKRKIIDDLTEQLDNYKQKKENEDDDVKLEQVEEIKDEFKGNDMKEDLKYLEEKLNGFSEIYDENKMKEIYENLTDLLMVNDEINAMDLKVMSFSKYLNDIKLCIDKLMYVDVKKYKEWNINEIVQWICILDDGKYRKYLNVFREGFKLDNIKGLHLPDLDKKDLRAAPFNISDFEDRKNLEKHFKSLDVKVHNAENTEEVENIEETETEVTEVHV